MSAERGNNQTNLQLICRIGEVIASGVEYPEGLRRIAELVAEHTGAGVCNVLIYDERSGELVLQATYGFDQDALEKVHVPASKGIVGTVFRNLEVINAARKQDHPAYHPFQTPKATDFQGLLAVPLVAGGHCIGVLNLERPEPERFPDPAVATVRAIASSLASYLRNAFLLSAVDVVARNTAVHQPDRILRGTPITDGVVRGTVYRLVGTEVLSRIEKSYTEDPEQELERLEQAIHQAREDTLELQDEASEILAEADAGIFFAHLTLLEDPWLIGRIKQAVTEHNYSLRYALRHAYAEVEHEFSLLDSELVRERLADVKDVILRIFQGADETEAALPGTTTIFSEVAKDRKLILVTSELLPSQLVRLPLADLDGIACEQGGTTSHVAILARTMRIPMVVGIRGAMDKVETGQDAILDCSSGLLYVQPDEEVLSRFEPALRYHQEARSRPLSCPVPITRDGVPMRLAANLSLINELPLVERYSAAGVGLYRTEFLFMIRNSYPSEEEQYDVFRRVVEAVGDPGVTIRLIDIGGDKPLPYSDFGNEDNPVLGLRGIRFLLDNPQFLDPHLRAILRASAHGRVNILLPMVADIEELLLCKEALARAEKQLSSQGLEFNPDYGLGIMVEVPSAIWDLPRMLDHLDFASIGTNDLTQYAFAVDRGNQRVIRWFRQFHPVVLQMLRQICEIVRSRPGKVLALCGEIAGNPIGTPLLIGAGIRNYSMNPWRIPKVAAAANCVTTAECEELFDQAVGCTYDADVVRLMHEFAASHGIEAGDPAGYEDRNAKPAR